MPGSVRRAAVAGQFYPGESLALSRTIDTLLGSASAGPAPKAIVVPHAGYVYSGPVAASAYARLAALAGRAVRVVLLGPTHRLAVRGLALPGVDVFETPLGDVPIDRRAVDSIAGMPQVASSPAAHAAEHSLEVQLPFLQRVLGTFTLLPLAVGSASPEDVADVLERLWGGPDTVIVVSSDLSHYHPYAAAQRIDRATAEAIVGRESSITHEQACGATPLNGFLLVARRKRLVPELLDLRNSGDTAGDRSRVVGYGAFAFFEPDHEH